MYDENLLFKCSYAVSEIFRMVPINSCNHTFLTADMNWSRHFDALKYTL